MIPVLPLDAPIEPGRGLGGFELGRNIGAYEGLLSCARVNDINPVKGLRGFEATYSFPQLFEETDEEFIAWDDRVQEWMSARRAGQDAGELPVSADPPQGDPAVEVVVDIRDGVIVSVFAKKGYGGRLLDEVSVGMTYRDVSGLLSLEWSEVVVGRVVPGIEGLALHFERDEFDWSEEELSGRLLESIGVFLPERTDSGRIGLSL